MAGELVIRFTAISVTLDSDKHWFTELERVIKDTNSKSTEKMLTGKPIVYMLHNSMINQR